MSSVISRYSEQDVLSPLRAIADQAFSRAAGAPLVHGNRLRILKDAGENYPVWLEAMRAARKRIFFESYIIRDDEVGRQFAGLLAAKAREGVHVRLIYDWMGSRRGVGRSFWRNLTESGVEVRCFNPPRFDSPLGWLSRDHRKMISVDGRVGFVSGLCIDRRWVGRPKRGIGPWRDTGVEIEGPAVADIDQAFAETWAACGAPIAPEELQQNRESIAAAGEVALRVVASSPSVAGVYRLDQLVAAIARRSIWLTDAYFVGTTAYVQALRAAASDGVDVRLLVPRSTDVPFIGALSRAGFRPLLEAGVRVFEWNGPMLHAKTAVADGRWARVGSTNLNLASWIGNWELDVVVEDDLFAREMEQMYLDDLAFHRNHPQRTAPVALIRGAGEPIASRPARARKRGSRRIQRPHSRQHGERRDHPPPPAGARRMDDHDLRGRCSSGPRRRRSPLAARDCHSACGDLRLACRLVRNPGL
ncbi:MAG TPA: phospholipase D-like domain-containing protein [Terriglobia bacterium]|nr:phospholipase D-like domain-containing protein [Terriglobia bacterium]